MAEILEERCEVREDGIYLIYVTEDEEIENRAISFNTSSLLIYSAITSPFTTLGNYHNI